MMTLNLKAVASAFAALAVTVVLSWTFVDAHERRARVSATAAPPSWPPSVLWYAKVTGAL